MFFQHASERDFVETVEQITGRKVRTFVSGVDTKQDVSSEVFSCGPPPGPSGSFGAASPGQASHASPFGECSPHALGGTGTPDLAGRDRGRVELRLD
jgi:hypothetical protein